METFDHPFGSVVAGEAVKPTFFNPTEGYRPKGHYTLKTYGSGYTRQDAGAFEEELPMTSTALAERPMDAMPQSQIDLIRRTVANGATNDELSLFLYDCQRRGIHPLDKLLHFTKRGGKYTPVTSIDFMRAQAAMSGEMAGSDDPVFTMNGEKLEAATVTVYRLTQGQRFAYAATARWSEYCPDNAQMWRRMPHTMLGKCAEALALRKAFPQQLAGLYSSEEMDQAAIQAPQREVAQSVERASEKREAAGSTPALPAISVGSLNETLKDDGPDLGTADDEHTNLPEGYRYIDEYRIDGDWHHVTWGRDAQNGWMTYKTKLGKVGLAAKDAYDKHQPVRLFSNKFPFLDKVESLGISREQIDASKWQPDHDDPRRI